MFKVGDFVHFVDRYGTMDGIKPYSGLGFITKFQHVEEPMFDDKPQDLVHIRVMYGEQGNLFKDPKIQVVFLKDIEPAKQFIDKSIEDYQNKIAMLRKMNMI